MPNYERNVNFVLSLLKWCSTNSLLFHFLVASFSREIVRNVTASLSRSYDSATYTNNYPAQVVIENLRFTHADLWALTAVLFACLTGLRKEDFMSSGRPKMVRANVLFFFSSVPVMFSNSASLLSAFSRTLQLTKEATLG